LESAVSSMGQDWPDLSEDEHCLACPFVPILKIAQVILVLSLEFFPSDPHEKAVWCGSPKPLVRPSTFKKARTRLVIRVPVLQIPSLWTFRWLRFSARQGFV